MWSKATSDYFASKKALKKAYSKRKRESAMLPKAMSKAHQTEARQNNSLLLVSDAARRPTLAIGQDLGKERRNFPVGPRGGSLVSLPNPERAAKLSQAKAAAAYKAGLEPIQNVKRSSPRKYKSKAFSKPMGQRMLLGGSYAPNNRMAMSSVKIKRTSSGLVVTRKKSPKS